MIILGLGCNIGDRLANLRQTLQHLYKIPDLKIRQISPIYESDALLPENTPPEWDMPYLNLAIRCDTKLDPQTILEQTKNIEFQMGRAEHLHWSPRIIDIDILAWDNKTYNTEALQIPHQDLLNRPFAIWPLADVAPNWQYNGITAQEIIKPWGSKFDGKAPLHTRQIAHRIDTPQMIGILNITPNSFADGGKYETIETAITQAQHLFQSGADIIDIGAESTRPAGTAITPAQEWQRLEPILNAIYDLWQDSTFKPKISIDTRNPMVAEKALAYNIDWLNDVTGFDDPKMRQIAINSSVKLVFMHHLRIPENRDIHLPFDQNPVDAVYQWAKTRSQELIAMGIDQDRLIFDPGIGFGKHAEQSFTIIKRIVEFKKLGLPILAGHSRKTFLSQFTDKPFIERDLETAIIGNFLAEQQVDYLRVHNVAAQMQALKINKALA